MPGADESPGRFRTRLYETLRRRLPPSNEWASARADDLAPDARSVIEGFIITAAEQEGLRPSVANLPPDREITRSRTDPETGAKSTEFFAKELFVKSLGRPGRRVVRLLDPKSRTVIWGAPMERYETSGHYSPY